MYRSIIFANFHWARAILLELCQRLRVIQYTQKLLMIWLIGRCGEWKIFGYDIGCVRTKLVVSPLRHFSTLHYRFLEYNGMQIGKKCIQRNLKLPWKGKLKTTENGKECMKINQIDQNISVASNWRTKKKVHWSICDKLYNRVPIDHDNEITFCHPSYTCVHESRQNKRCIQVSSNQLYVPRSSSSAHNCNVRKYHEHIHHDLRLNDTWILHLWTIYIWTDVYQWVGRGKQLAIEIKVRGSWNRKHKTATWSSERNIYMCRRNSHHGIECNNNRAFSRGTRL